MKNKTMNLLIGLVVLILVLNLMLIGYAITGNVIKKQTIRIGILTPLSGDLAFLGENVVRSAELAAIDLGYQDKVEFIIEDAGGVGRGEEAISAYRKLVDIDKIEVIIDGMASDGTMAVTPLIDKDKVVMITPLTGGENIDNAAEYLFRNGPSDIIAGTKPANDIYNLGHEKAVLLTDNAEYTTDISKHFRNKYKGKIVFDELLDPNKKDFRTEISKFQKKDFDAIIINTASGNSAAYIIKQLYESGNTKPIFANFIAFNANTLKIAGTEAFEEVYIYDPEFDENTFRTKNFFKKYEKQYKTNPSIPFHTTGTFDAVKMIIEAVEETKYNGKEIHNYLLENIQDWQGMNGIISFDKKGNTETGFVLKQVRNGELINP